MYDDDNEVGLIVKGSAEVDGDGIVKEDVYFSC